MTTQIIMRPTVALGLMLGLILSLGACAPKAQIQSNVIPTLISVNIDEATGNLSLQGRYFGDGQGGLNGGSYVIVGADIYGNGGIRVAPSTWTASKLTLPIPSGAGRGYAFVVVKGVKSNGLPANLP
ncbi:MAG: hypothetical protein R2880_12175 [Deinococcales bacterium]